MWGTRMVLIFLVLLLNRAFADTNSFGDYPFDTGRSNRITNQNIETWVQAHYESFKQEKTQQSPNQQLLQWLIPNFIHFNIRAEIPEMVYQPSGVATRWEEGSDVWGSLVLSGPLSYEDAAYISPSKWGPPRKGARTWRKIQPNFAEEVSFSPHSPGRYEVVFAQRSDSAIRFFWLKTSSEVNPEFFLSCSGFPGNCLWFNALVCRDIVESLENQTFDDIPFHKRIARNYGNIRAELRNFQLSRFAKLLYERERIVLRVEDLMNSVDQMIAITPAVQILETCIRWTVI